MEIYFFNFWSLMTKKIDPIALKFGQTYDQPNGALTERKMTVDQKKKN